MNPVQHSTKLGNLIGRFFDHRKYKHEFLDTQSVCLELYACPFNFQDPAFDDTLGPQATTEQVSRIFDELSVDRAPPRWPIRSNQGRWVQSNCAYCPATIAFLRERGPNDRTASQGDLRLFRKGQSRPVGRIQCCPIHGAVSSRSSATNPAHTAPTTACRKRAATI